MMLENLTLQADSQTGEAILRSDDGRSINLHPTWLRERANDARACDPISKQRLYDPCALPVDLRIEAVKLDQTDQACVRFSDGYEAVFDPGRLAMECGWIADPEQTPKPIVWDATLSPLPETTFPLLDDPVQMRGLLEGFFKYGFCIIRDTPSDPQSLITLARRFGYIRETNFGRLFDVFTKTDATDLAYTALPLTAHTDNPYRQPVPGIQFLHCVKNNVAGGLSTIVDGLALVTQLTRDAPEEAKILEKLPVRFRYDTPSCIIEDSSPLIERDINGRLVGLRLSTRLDFVAPADPEILDLFYAGRRRLQIMAADPGFAISFPFEPGLLLMMDNRRTLHGRTAFDGKAGERHLQGCYIDHDGPSSLYRILARDGIVSLGQEAS